MHRSIRAKHFTKAFLLCGLGMGCLGCASPGPKSDHVQAASNTFVAELEPQEEQKNQAQALFVRAQIAAFLDHKNQAIEYYSKALQIEPDNADFHRFVAVLLAEEHNIEAAFHHAKKAILLQPQDSVSRMLLGGLYLSSEQMDLALEQYDKVPPESEHYAEAVFLKGLVYMQKNQLQTSKQLFLSSLKLKMSADKKSDVYFYLGKVYELNTPPKRAKARGFYKQSLKQNPDNLRSLKAILESFEFDKKTQHAIDFMSYWQETHGPFLEIAQYLAQYYLQQQDQQNTNHKKALDQLDIILRHDPQNANAHLQVAASQVFLGEKQKAMQALERAARLLPRSDRIKFYLGDLYKDLNMYQKAKEQLLSIPASSEYYVLAVVHASNMLLELKKYSEALALVRKGIKSLPQNANLYAQAFFILKQEGKKKKAINVLYGAVEKMPQNAQLWYLLGDEQYQDDQPQRAIESMQQVIAHNPQHSGGLNYLAYIYAELGINLDQAEKMARRAVELSPKSAHIMDTLGWVLYKKQEYQEALVWLKKAYRKQPNHKIIAQHLATIHAAIKDASKVPASVQSPLPRKVPGQLAP